MRNLLLLASILILTFTACRHKKEVVQITMVTVPVAEAALPAPVGKPATLQALDTSGAEKYRFIVSFYSIGEGVDYMAHRNFIAHLKDLKRMNKQIHAEETRWGREGEVDYCMKLTEFNEVEQRDIINNLKTVLADARWVHYFENAPCRNKNWGKETER